MDRLLELIRTVKNTWEYTFTKKTSDISAYIELKLSEKGMTKTALAQELGVSRSCVSHMLNGDMNFTIKTISKIAVVFDSSFEDVVTYERPKRRPESFNYETVSTKSSNFYYGKICHSKKKETNIIPLAA